MPNTEITYDEQIATAEQDATDAAALVAKLEEDLLNGNDKITVQDIEASESLARFASLRAESTRRKAENARKEARLAELKTLHDDIAANTETGTKALVNLLKKVETALDAYVTAAADREGKLQSWRTELARLSVPALLPGQPASVEHGNLGQHHGALIVDDRVLTTIYPFHYLRLAIGLVELRHPELAGNVSSHTSGTDTVYEELARAAATSEWAL